MRSLVLLLASFLSLPTYANTSFSDTEIKLVHSVLREKDTNITLQQTKYRMVENAFLLEQATQLHPSILKRQSPVGFSSDHHARRYTLSLLKGQFNLPTATKINAKMWQPYSAKWLKSNLPAYPSNNTYTTDQLAKLDKIDLSHLAKKPLTLALLMSEQSMQNRYRLHQGDINLFKSLINEHHRFNLIMQTLSTSLNAQGLSQQKLEHIAKAELLRPVMLSYFGVLHSMHGARSAYVEALQQSITNRQINDYFQANKQSFKYIKKVKANAVFFKSKVQAEQFYKYALKYDFARAVTHFKQNDIFAKTQGIVERQNKSSWAHQVAFSLQPQQLSKPIRTPQGQWFVAQTLSRFYDYYDKESETVKYQAKLALTEVLAKNAYQKHKAKWIKSNNITL
ncbi:hypothetical protein PSECIP111951_03056 [Pseudoalteromonas holothuriae]|uniref:PpiC domain-containing protein n=1 Tax=Pseudoalteromonas holothuriae TaxID=2963714 RepID=A0ABM9GKW5_9GAMM|nr:peptidyl-prolyl cis-trans isomerase [Pseudoalteromonas sp. CIP111951]CAH9064134.1 hypothetical protein PSECIP111951_03056 [Pseudoalteromonas sp. CIP111951]